MLPITWGGSLADGIYDGLRYSVFHGCTLYTLARGHDEEAFPLIRRINRRLREHPGPGRSDPGRDRSGSHTERPAFSPPRF